MSDDKKVCGVHHECAGQVGDVAKQIKEVADIVTTLRLDVAYSKGRVNIILLFLALVLVFSATASYQSLITSKNISTLSKDFKVTLPNYELAHKKKADPIDPNDPTKPEEKQEKIASMGQ